MLSMSHFVREFIAIDIQFARKKHFKQNQCIVHASSRKGILDNMVVVSAACTSSQLWKHTWVLLTPRGTVREVGERREKTSASQSMRWGVLLHHVDHPSSELMRSSFFTLASSYEECQSTGGGALLQGWPSGIASERGMWHPSQNPIPNLTLFRMRKGNKVMTV